MNLKFYFLALVSFSTCRTITSRDSDEAHDVRVVGDCEPIAQLIEQAKIAENFDDSKLIDICTTNTDCKSDATLLKCIKNTCSIGYGLAANKDTIAARNRVRQNRDYVRAVELLTNDKNACRIVSGDALKGSAACNVTTKTCDLSGPTSQR